MSRPLFYRTFQGKGKKAKMCPVKSEADFVGFMVQESEVTLNDEKYALTEDITKKMNAYFESQGLKTYGSKVVKGEEALYATVYLKFGGVEDAGF